MRTRSIIATAVLLLFLSTNEVLPASPRSAIAQRGMVVSSESIAADVGCDVLRDGGNAVDAAIATCAVLNVTEGYNCGMGGGCFILVYWADSGRVYAIDGRERAPLTAHRDLYLDPDDKTVIEGLSTEGATAVATPGQPAALEMIHSRWGSLSWSELLSRAVALADTGFMLSRTYAEKLAASSSRLFKYASSRAVFSPHGDTTPYRFGDRLVQKDLARFLRDLSSHGAHWFYDSRFSRDLAGFVKVSGGYLTPEDLLSYNAVLRDPVHCRYRGYDIYSMPPPSSGGVHVAQILEMLEPFRLAESGAGSSESLHLMIEAMKRAFADRAHYLGDPDFGEVPMDALLDSAYIARHTRAISSLGVSKVDGPGDLPLDNDSETTHFSVIDAYGNMVAFTASLNTSFGSGVILPGWGLLLNNHMDDFSIQVGVPNYYGLVGSEANAIEPGKRPLSSMSPTLVMRNGEPAGILGSPGGPRIISTVVQVFLNIVEYGMDVQAAVDFPRVHHQWKPDQVYAEMEIVADVIINLQARGHKVVRNSSWSSAQCIWIDSESGGAITGGTDSRSEGKAAGY